MGELVNLMSGIAGVTVQARDIEGGLHFHLTVPDPFRANAARQVELGARTAEALAVVLRDLDVWLSALGVAGAELPTAIDHVTRAVLLQFRREYDPTPAKPPPELTPKLGRLVGDLAAYAAPERLLAHRFYFSTRKVVASHRAYQHHLEDDENANPERRFLALHRHFLGSGRLVFGPARLLPGNPPPDSDQWVYFTGEFALTRDDAIFDRVPEARAVLSSGNTTNLHNIATAIFGARDPFFYPYLEFRGSVADAPATMVVSRRHLVLGSATVTTLAGALRGRALAVAGFGTLAPPDSGLRQIHPILFRADYG